MINLFQGVIGGFGLWLLVQFFLSWGWSYAHLIAIVAALWLWQINRRWQAMVSLLLVSLLIDAVAYPSVPLTLLTSLVAGWLYIEFIEPHLSSTTSLGQLLGIASWLLLWRVCRLALMVVVWLVNNKLGVPSHISVVELLIWFGSGFGLWWLVQLGNRFFKPQTS